MAAGANVGEPPEQWARCTGPTGLSIGEIDKEEPAGCPLGSNNFLAPLEGFVGNQFIMLINEFSNSGSGYTLTFGGTAVLDCMNVSVSPSETNPQSDFVVYPTLSTGTIFISITSDRRLTDNHLNIFNMEGQVVYSEELVTGTNHQVDLDYLPQGTYIAILRTSNSIQTKKFLLTK